MLSQDVGNCEYRLFVLWIFNIPLFPANIKTQHDFSLLLLGFGESVGTAKEMAAREALKKIFGTEDHMKPINFHLQGIPKPNSQARYQIAAS